MVLKKVVLVSALVVTGCGGSSGGGGDTPNVQPGAGPRDQDANPRDDEDNEGFYDPSIIADSNGEKVSITKLPSVIEDGKWVDTCKEGQIYFEDHCYDTIHLSDKEAGFRLESNTKTFAMGPVPSEESKENFATRVPHLGDKTYLYQYRITWKCGPFTLGCMLPSNISDGVVIREVEGFEYIEELFVSTFFNWGSDLPRDAPHIWFSNGTIELNGSVYDLPLTRKKLREAYPEYQDYSAIKNGYTEIKFEFLSSDIWGVEVEPNAEDQPLKAVRYKVDNIQREQDLQNPDES